MVKIPWARPSIAEEEIEAVHQVLKSGWLSQGEQVRKFEEEICAYVGCKYAVCVTNGTLALALCYLVIRNLLVESGESVADDGVVAYIPNTTFAATSSVPISVGIPFIPVEVDYETCLSTLDHFQTARKRTEYFHDSYAVLSPVHLLGSAVDLEGFQELISSERGTIVEDACQAFGVIANQGMVGQNSDFCVFSFHMAKLISTVEGGCITTNNPTFDKLLRQARSYGINKNYKINGLGLNARMTDISAAIGRVQLSKAEVSIAHRAKLKQLYVNRLAKAGRAIVVKTPKHVLREVPTMAAFRVPDPEALHLYLQTKGIDSRTFFPPLSGQYPQLTVSENYKDSNSKKLYSEIILLPIGNHITEDEVNQVCDAVEEFIK